MKKIMLLVIFLVTLQGFSQQQVYLLGFVTDSLFGFPIPGHPVMIFSDSTGGITYYNTVYTDSSGYYYDHVPVLNNAPGKFIVYTFDCNNQSVTYEVSYSNDNDTIRQDFQICTINNWPCEAYFYAYPDSLSTPLAYQFIDQSAGNLSSWLWSFGDSTFSQEQYPYHIFPGPGTFEVCLTITGSDCADTYCEVISISEEVFYQLYGQVYEGNFPMTTGTVMIHALNPAGGFAPLDEGFRVDSSGIYYFTLVPDGMYILQAIPDATNAYLPTYFGGVTSWQSATAIMPSEINDLVNINLVAAGPLNPGPGSVQGHISMGNFRPGDIDQICMFLMNEDFVPVSFTKLNDEGFCKFSGIAFGSYYIRAELSGVFSDNIKIEISEINPDIEINLTYSGNSILGIEDERLLMDLKIVYPNPVKDLLTVTFGLTEMQEIIIEVYSLTGQLVYRDAVTGAPGRNVIQISFGDLPPGYYSLTIISERGFTLTEKVLKCQ
jgi:PKD repeat protein